MWKGFKSLGKKLKELPNRFPKITRSQFVKYSNEKHRRGPWFLIQLFNLSTLGQRHTMYMPDRNIESKNKTCLMVHGGPCQWHNCIDYSTNLQ